MAEERPTAMTTESGPSGHYVKHFHPMGEPCSIRDEARAQVLDQLVAEVNEIDPQTLVFRDVPRATYVPLGAVLAAIEKLR